MPDSHAIKHPIPPGEPEKGTPYYKMPIVYKQYGIHQKGTEFYYWYGRETGEEQVREMVAECSGNWEAVYRSISEAFLL